ncbi:uncharacterized protein V6R79_023984 [Siganus canaliculatus]
MRFVFRSWSSDQQEAPEEQVLFTPSVKQSVFISVFISEPSLLVQFCPGTVFLMSSELILCGLFKEQRCIQEHAAHSSSFLSDCFAGAFSVQPFSHYWRAEDKTPVCDLCVTPSEMDFQLMQNKPTAPRGPLQQRSLASLNTSALQRCCSFQLLLNSFVAEGLLELTSFCFSELKAAWCVKQSEALKLKGEHQRTEPEPTRRFPVTPRKSYRLSLTLHFCLFN